MGGRGKFSVFLIAAVAMMAGPFALAAGAVTNACTNGMFPNQPGGNSELSIACTLTTATGGAGNAYTIEDFPDAVWHTGAARVSGADGHITAASATVTSATARFVPGDVDHIISGGLPGFALPSGTFIKTFVNATTVTINAPAPTGSTTTTAVLKIDNTTGRSATGSTTAGSKTVTSTTANFVAGDVGRVISATSIPHGDTIATFTNATTVVLTTAATTTAASKVISIADAATLTSNRQIKDAHTTAASATVTSATAVFAATDIGLPVTGANVPAGDYVATAPSATTITLHVAATITSTAAVLTIGVPNSTAAQNGEAMAQLSSKLSLDPTAFGGAVDGSPPCSANVLNASSLSGEWQNPGSYNATALGSSTDPSIKGSTVGQIIYPTSVISFAGYVTIVKAATAGETQTLAHYDIVLPTLLTSAVVCPAPSAVGVASVFRFDASTVSQGLSGGSLRSLKDFPAGLATKSTSASVHVIKTGTGTLFTGTTACVETYPGAATFGCGNG
jgi:hypothetical protein